MQSWTLLGPKLLGASVFICEMGESGKPRPVSEGPQSFPVKTLQELMQGGTLMYQRAGQKTCRGDGQALWGL